MVYFACFCLKPINIFADATSWLQHAVHERVRLEAMLAQYTTTPTADPDGLPAVVLHQLTRPLSLALSAGQQEILAENPELCRRFGLVTAESVSKRGRERNSWFAQIPQCFAQLEVEKRDSLLIDLGKLNLSKLDLAWRVIEPTR